MTVVELEAARGAGKSVQGDQGDPFTPKGAIDPPENLEQLAKLTQVSRTRRSCIEAIVQNTVGLGFELVANEGEDVSEEELRGWEQHLDTLARRDERLGRPSFTRLLAAVKWDEEEVGNGRLEVSRNAISTQIDGLYHVPGKRVRRLKDRDGYVMYEQLKPVEQMTRFYDFGEKYEDGRIRTGRDKAINELIAFHLFTSESRDYGLPRDTQLAVDYLADKRAAEQNAGHFENNGVPPTVIFVQGTESQDGQGPVPYEVSPRLVQQIADTLKGQGGRDNRVAIVPVPPGTQTDRHDLARISDRDIGHVDFRRDVRRATLGAFRISPVFVADIEDAGKYTADVERAITKEQLFDPEQNRWADIINQTIVAEITDGRARLRFKEIAIAHDEKRRAGAAALAERSALTNREYREAHDFPPLEEGDAIPEGWGEQLVASGEGALVSALGEPDLLGGGSAG